MSGNLGCPGYRSWLEEALNAMPRNLPFIMRSAKVLREGQYQVYALERSVCRMAERIRGGGTEEGAPWEAVMSTGWVGEMPGREVTLGGCSQGDRKE